MRDVNSAHPERMPDAVRTNEISDDAHIGRYRIVRKIGSTPASEVVLAVAQGAHGFERQVVIKRLMPHAKGDPKMSRGFGREASAYARLTHPAIVRLYDFFTVDDMPAMVLEYIDGISLQDLLDAMREKNTRLPFEAAMYVAARIFAALSAAHSARDPQTRDASPVIHRDVTPSSVLLSRDGDVKLGNFGFAKLVGGDVTTSLTAVSADTSSYMAPEQLLCEEVTARTDVYAGALVTRELLVGKPAFVRGERPYVDYLQEMAKPALTPIAEACPALPPEIAEALARALAPESSKRAIKAVDLQRLFNAHREGGRTQLREMMDRLGLVVPEAKVDDVAASAGDVPDDEDVPIEEGEPEPYRKPISTLPSILRSRSRARRTRLAAIALGVMALVACAFAAKSGPKLAHGSAPAQAMIRVPNVTPVPITAAVEPSAPADAASAPIVARSPVPEPAPPAPTTGDLRTLPSSPPHRVYVDGKLVGESGAVVSVACGAHAVRVGTRGKPVSVNVPCGGSAELATR